MEPTEPAAEVPSAEPSLADRLRSIRDSLRAARAGELSVRLPIDPAEAGLLAEIALAFYSLGIVVSRRRD
jgi:hypothetical protein